MDQRTAHLRHTSDVLATFGYKETAILTVLRKDETKHAYLLQDGCVIVGEDFINERNQNIYREGWVTLFDSLEEFHEKKWFDITLTKETIFTEKKDNQRR